MELGLGSQVAGDGTAAVVVEERLEVGAEVEREPSTQVLALYIQSNIGSFLCANNLYWKPLMFPNCCCESCSM